MASEEQRQTLVLLKQENLYLFMEQEESEANLFIAKHSSEIYSYTKIKLVPDENKQKQVTFSHLFFNNLK